MMPRVFFCFLLILPAVWLAQARADNLPDLGDESAAALSPAQELQLGESIMREIHASPAYLDDPDIADYLNDLGLRLTSNSPEPGRHFEFFLIEDNTVNAFALPGGYIGVHTGLLLVAQSESELASVLGHEIAHVTQHHVARMIAAQHRAGMASMAALALAILAARSNANVSEAAIAAAAAAPIQSGLTFTRENEREADRIGLQIVEKSGFDAHAMPVFFERLQRATRVYDSGAPSYLRTHPVTYERIAEIENRIQSLPYRQVPDSLDFQLVRARLAARQGTPREAVQNFSRMVSEHKYVSEASARYGLVFALLRANDLKRAGEELPALQALARDDPMVASLAAEVNVKRGAIDQGLAIYKTALGSYPSRNSLAYGYARALIGLGRYRQAADFVTDRIEDGQEDARLYELQAQAYAALGKKLAHHRAQAEAYLLRGNLRGAIEQLQIAKAAGDGDFYQQSAVEARLKELMQLDTEQHRKN